jgi:hypothetical protein
VKSRTIELSAERRIIIFDDVFDYAYRDTIYAYVAASRYTIGWHDTNHLDKATHRYLHSIYNDEDMRSLGLLRNMPQGILGLIPGRWKRSVVNLSVPSDVHFPHKHDETGLLYYANMEWQLGWGGETLFYEDDGKEILYACAYTPGRLVMFSPGVLHAVRPQSAAAPHYRFTLANFFS